MKRSMYFALTLITLAVLALTASAQDGKHQGHQQNEQQPRQQNVFGVSRFLQHETVRTELGLSSEQNKQLQKLFDEAPAPGSTQREVKSQAEEFQGKTEKILTPEQYRKYLELSFQLTGGLDNPNFTEHTFDTLHLSNDQVINIQNTLREQRQAAKSEGKQLKDLTPEQRNKNKEAIHAVLTSEQLEKAKTLTESVKEVRQKLGLAHNPNANESNGKGKHKTQKG
jgi:Spy/CpxP family protein refolding chaperone